MTVICIFFQKEAKTRLVISLKTDFSSNNNSVYSNNVSISIKLDNKCAYAQFCCSFRVLANTIQYFPVLNILRTKIEKMLT